MPVSTQFLHYIKEQIKFLNELDGDILDNVNIRLDASSPSRGWNITNALDIAGYFDLIDNSSASLLSSLGNSRLCICTHNATVFLETFTMNFPTIIFWDPKYYEIRSDATKFFDTLEEAEILFYTAEEAARKVNDISSNIDEWWFSDRVQSARKKFCERYAATSNDWEREWGEFLLGVKKI
jgi:putative transferase (TIGR04331 family)